MEHIRWLRATETPRTRGHPLKRPYEEDPKTRSAIERFDTDVSRDPNDAYAYLNMGLWWHWKRKYAEALNLFGSSGFRVGNRVV
jgi:hypothetical protein